MLGARFWNRRRTTCGPRLGGTLAQDDHRVALEPFHRPILAPGQSDDLAVRCAECLKQLHAEAAIKLESEDQTRHFCGLTCLRRGLLVRQRS